MYIDKKVKAHNLLQTIARVNRVANGKDRGYIVDYIGLTDHLKDALSIYADDDQADVTGTLTDITQEVPVLESRYRRLIVLFQENGVADIEPFVNQSLPTPDRDYEVLEQAVEVMEDIKLRASFDVYLKKFLQSMDIILPNPAATPYKISAKRLGYLLVKIKQRYKDDTLSISNAGAKVRKLIDEHLVSLGIDPKIPPVELLSPKFIQEMKKDAQKSPKATASEMEHAIRKHCKVHMNEDPVLYQKLSEKLEGLIKQYRDEWEQLSQHLFDLRDETEAGRQDDIEGVNTKARPFYDLLGRTAFGDSIPAEHDETLKGLANEVMDRLQQTIGIINFWNNGPEVAKLRGELSDLLLFSGVDEFADKCEQIVTEVTALAKARHEDIVD